VPARNEAERLDRLLDALADQDIEGPIRVVLALNNTTDRSAQIGAEASRRHGDRLSLLIDNHVFAPDLAHAGSARERAMSLGSGLLDQARAGVLISTDADTRPPPDWVRRNLEAVAGGADLVGGRLAWDEAEAVAPPLRYARDLWDGYWARVRAIEDELDPSACDPAPRHGDHTGASLAITIDAYATAGGVPRIPSGEDRALVAAAVGAGRRLAHPLNVWTRVSPRLDGRAVGGMAVDMRRLQAEADEGRHPTAPDFAHWRARVLWRRDLRARIGPAAMLAAEAALPPMPHDMVLCRPAAPGDPS